MDGLDKKVLIIGGSYFVGRVFCMLASRERYAELYVVNRGRYSLDAPNVHEYKSDRHDTKNMLSILPDVAFDAVIDFCAYEPGDIAEQLRALRGRCKRYVYISTSSVYEPSELPKTEDTPLLGEFAADEVSQYVAKKLSLERELADEAAKDGTDYVVIRPSFIYGPYNYAPRESWFIKKIVQGGTVPMPTDATADFNMVYVSDVARALMLVAAKPGAANMTYNLAAPERVNYGILMEQLERQNGAPFALQLLDVDTILERDIPLPFPLKQNDLLCAKLFTDQFDFTWTPFDEGMRKTFKAFKQVFVK
ncbi:MAG: NAD-dependent epimerase/dehydratase family protein [Coriobacteriales bacterium]|jgi:nucleoside-diphosphate-sugar epimerase|nr:NAD-dependent epimerase/dehydratase family protein [Coriobacteriales bacterium]